MWTVELITQSATTCLDMWRPKLEVRSPNLTLLRSIFYRLPRPFDILVREHRYCSKYYLEANSGLHKVYCWFKPSPVCLFFLATGM